MKMEKFIRRLQRGNMILLGPAFLLFVFGILIMCSDVSFAADQQLTPAQVEQQTLVSARGTGFIAAAIAVGLSCIAAGLAVGMSNAAAMGAVAERPELMGRALLFVGLAEGVAIYGLVIGIMILAKV